MTDTDTDRLAALLHDVSMEAYGQKRWAQAPWPTDLYDWIAARLIAAGVTLDPQPDTASECFVCGEVSVGTFPLCGVHGTRDNLDPRPAPEPEYLFDASCPHCRDKTPHHPRPAPDTALREACEEACERLETVFGAPAMPQEDPHRWSQAVYFSMIALRAALEAER